MTNGALAGYPKARLLDAVMSAQWEDAVAGNVRATQAVLRAIEKRVRLLGLVAAWNAHDRGPTALNFWTPALPYTGS